MSILSRSWVKNCIIASILFVKEVIDGTHSEDCAMRKERLISFQDTLEESEQPLNTNVDGKTSPAALIHVLKFRNESV